MKRNQLIALAVALTAALATGCGPGFKSAEKAACTGADCTRNTGQGDNNGGNNGGKDTQAWQDLTLEGTVSGGTYQGTKAIGLDKANKMLIVRMPTFLIFDVLVGGEIPINKLPGAKIVIEPQMDGTHLVALHIPLELLLKGVNLGLPPAKLPNGDPLPMLPAGELPSLAVGISNIGKSKVDATLYLGPAVVAIFVNSPLNPLPEGFPTVSIPIRDEAGIRTFGYFSLVAKKGSYEGGFFLSFQMPPDLARIIDEVL